MGVVVLYQPPEGTKDVIESYLGEIDELIVIDNAGGSIVIDLLSPRHKLHIISNKKNKGIACSLNQAATYAASRHYEWLLMMDQDSTFAPGALIELKQFAAAAPERTGILSPVHATIHSGSKIKGGPFTELRIAMTSGSMLNLAAWSACGPFDEKLFIDSVDHEYSLRLRKRGWRVIQVNSATLNHRPGKVVRHNWLFITFHTSEHPASRHYFMTRNRMTVMARYGLFDPAYFLLASLEQLKAIGKIVLLEKEKGRKLGFTFQGIFHFLVRRFPHHA